MERGESALMHGLKKIRGRSVFMNKNKQKKIHAYIIHCTRYTQMLMALTGHMVLKSAQEHVVVFGSVVWI